MFHGFDLIQLILEHCFLLKSCYRYQKSFHGVDLTPLHEEAMQEYFRQPIVDTFDIRICMSKSIKHSVDFLNDKESDLHEIGMQKSLCSRIYSETEL